MDNRYCVIMAGGTGSRFWPLSQENKPKQFIDILSTGKSMLRETYERALDVVNKENILIITNQLYKDLVLEHVPELLPSQVLYEPLKRNTAPCIAYAAHRIFSQNENAIMLVAPSDHYIGNVDAFNIIINNCFDIAESRDILMTVGVRPTRPETGYGYIQIDTPDVDSVYKVKTFTEKPDKEMAMVFMDSGDFLWNSGMFIWSCKSIIDSFQKYAPHINDLFKEGIQFYNTPKEQAFINQVFPECESISIDYCIMEKAKNVYVHDAKFTWSDIGTWGSLYEHIEKDENSNATNSGETRIFNSKNCIIKTQEGKTVVIDGLENYIIVDSNDGLLICPMENEQKIRQYINETK